MVQPLWVGKRISDRRECSGMCLKDREESDLLEEDRGEEGREPIFPEHFCCALEQG